MLHSASPLRAFAWRWKWVLVALLFASLVQASLGALRAQHPASASVVIASRELSSGEEISADAITTAQFPRQLIPEGTLSDTAAAEGKTIVAPIPKGGLIMEGQLLTSQFTTKAPPGTIITPVTLDDATMANIIQVGDTLSLYAPAESGSEDSQAKLISESAVVMATRDSTESGGILNESKNTRVLFLAVARRDANLVIGIGAKTPLHGVITTPASG